jgi:mannose-6-phosphate isomerase-like protein (cupin superfamily)
VSNMAVDSRNPYLVLPGGAEEIWDGPIGTSVIVPSAATDGRLSVCEMPVAPGFMVPPHTHHDTDEYSYVVSGRVGARVGDAEFTAEPGSWILKPRGVMHTFWNAGPEAAHLIELVVPGRFEEFFRRSTDLARRGELTDEGMEALGLEYGTTVSMDWVEDLARRYGLQITI